MVCAACTKQDSSLENVHHYHSAPVISKVAQHVIALMKLLNAATGTIRACTAVEIRQLRSQLRIELR